MSITENEKATLNDLFTRCDADWDKLNDFEKKFIEDNKQRYEEYGDGIRLSPKQWAVLNRIEDVLTNGRPKR